MCFYLPTLSSVLLIFWKYSDLKGALDIFNISTSKLSRHYGKNPELLIDGKNPRYYRRHLGVAMSGLQCRSPASQEKGWSNGIDNVFKERRRWADLAKRTKSKFRDILFIFIHGNPGKPVHNMQSLPHSSKHLLKLLGNSSPKLSTLWKTSRFHTISL